MAIAAHATRRGQHVSRGLDGSSGPLAGEWAALARPSWATIGPQVPEGRSRRLVLEEHDQRANIKEEAYAAKAKVKGVSSCG